MSVDGGTMAQAVLYPPSISRSIGQVFEDRRRRAFQDRQRPLYVIRNSRPGGDFERVDRSTLKIVERAVVTLIGTQGVGDLYQLYLLAQRNGIDYNVTYIQQSFAGKPREPSYDPVPINRRTPA